MEKRRTVALWALGAVLVMGSICLTAVHTDTAEARPSTALHVKTSRPYGDGQISQTSEGGGGGLLSRSKRDVLFPSGVKICDQETLDQAVSNHLEYYHLRVCQDTVWEAFKIFWDRLPEGDEYHDWVNRCLHGALSVKEIGAHFSQSEEHIHLVRSRIAMDTARNSTEDMQFQSDRSMDNTGGDNDVTTSGPITAVGVDLVSPPYTRVTPAEIHEVVIATTTGSDITADVTVTKGQGHGDVARGHAHGAVPPQVAAATAEVPAAEALAYDTHKPTGQEVGDNTIPYMVEEEAVGGDTEGEESEPGGTEREPSPSEEEEEEESPQTSAIPARGEELSPEVPVEVQVPHAEVTLDSVQPDVDAEATPGDVGLVPTALGVQAEEQETLEGPDGHFHDLEVQLAEEEEEEDEVISLEEPDGDIQQIPGGSPSEVAAEVTRLVDEAASQTRPTVATPHVSPHSETWTEAPPFLSTGGTTASEAPGDLREVARTEEEEKEEEDSQIIEGGGAGEELLQGALEEEVTVREAAEERSEEEITEAERAEDETSQEEEEEEEEEEEGEIPDETQEDEKTGKEGVEEEREGVEPAEDPTLESADVENLAEDPTLESADVENLTEDPTLESADVEDLTEDPTLESADVEDLTEDQTLESADVENLAEESVEFAGEAQEVEERKEKQETTEEQTEETTGQETSDVTAEDETPEEPEPEVMEAEFMEAEIVDDAIQQTVDGTPVDSEEEVTSLAVDLQEDSEEVTSLAVDLQEDSEEVTSLAVDLQEDSEEVTSLAVDLQEDSEEVTSLAVDLQEDSEEAPEDEAVTEPTGGETDVPAQRPVESPGGPVESPGGPVESPGGPVESPEGPVESPRGSTVGEAPPPESPSEAAVEEMVRSPPEHTAGEEETGEGIHPEPTLVPAGDAEEARGEEPTQKIPEDIGDVSQDIRLEAEDLALDSLLEITPEPSDDITSDSPGDVTNDDLLGNNGFAQDEAQDNTIGNEVDESLRRPVGPVREQLVDLSIKLRGHSYHDDLRDPSSFYYQQLSKRFTAKIKEAFERLPGFKNAFVVEFRPQKDLDRGVVVSVRYSVLVEVDGSGLSGATVDQLTSQSLQVERSWTEEARLVHTVTDLRNHIVQALHNNFMTNSTLDQEPPSLGLQNVKNVFPSTSPPVDSFVSLDTILTAEKPPDIAQQQEVGGAELYLRKEDFPLDSFDQLKGPPQAASVNDVLLLDESTTATHLHLAPPTVAGAKGDQGFVVSHSADSSSSYDHGQGSGSGSSGDGAFSEEAWPRRPTSTEEEEQLRLGGGLEVLPPPDLEVEKEETEEEEEEEVVTEHREALVVSHPPHLTPSPTGPPPVLWTAQNLVVVEELSVNPVGDLVRPGEPSTESAGHLRHPGEPPAASTGPVDDLLLLQTNEEEEKHFILLPDEDDDDDEDDVQVLEEQEVVLSDSVTEATAAGLSEQDLTEDEVMEVVAPPETPDHNAPLSPEAESPFTRVSDTAPHDHDDGDHHDNGDDGHSEDGMVSLDDNNGHSEDGMVAPDNGAEVFIADPPEGAETGDGDTPLADEEELTSSDEVAQEAEPGWTAPGPEGSGLADGTDPEPVVMPTAPRGVALSPGGGAPGPEGGALTVFFSLRVTNMKFSMDLFNKSSEEYKHLEQQFIKLLVPFLQSNLSSFRQLEILNFRNGSVVVNSRMRVASPVPGGVASVVYLILENVVESAHQTMDLDIHTLDVESGDKADPCKFQACNEFSACQVNRWSGVAECVCRHGYVSLDGTPCRSLCDHDDATMTHYCHSHGTCDVIAGRGAVCRCAAGYHGDRCEELVSEAEPVVVAAAMATVAGFLLVASGAVYFLLRLLRGQNRPPDDTEKCHGNSVPSLDRCGKFNPAFQGDSGYHRYDDEEPPGYYRRLDDDLPPYFSTTLPPAGADRHEPMSPEELQHRLKVIESHTRDRYLADYIRQTHVFLDRRSSTT